MHFGVTQSDERSHHLIDQTDSTMCANGCVWKSIWRCFSLSQKTLKAVLWRPQTDILLTLTIVKSCTCPSFTAKEALSHSCTVLRIFFFNIYSTPGVLDHLKLKAHCHWRTEAEFVSMPVDVLWLVGANKTWAVIERMNLRDFFTWEFFSSFA